MQLLVLHQGAIGDFLLTLPVIQAVREYFSAASVSVIASAPSAALSAGRSVVDRWICPETIGLYRLFCRDLPVDEALKTSLNRSDRVLSFLSGPDHLVHERLIELASNNCEVVSIDPRPTVETRHTRLHISQQWVNDIRQAGWTIADARPTTLRWDRPVPARLDRTISSRVARILIHPGSGGVMKCWPMERFVELASTLSDKLSGTQSSTLLDTSPGVDITWMLGPAEAKQARMLQDRDEPILFEADLARAAEQMATFDLYVGNDSGITHLAAAIGLPTVAIFGTTDPYLWQPLGDHVTVVSPEEPHDDMAGVCVDDVRLAIMSRLSR